MDRDASRRQMLEIAYGGGPAKGYIWMEPEEETKVDAALSSDPGNRSLLTAKAILNFNHDAEVAIEYFSRALVLDPFDAHQYYNRGRKYLNTGRTAEGIADLTLSVRLDAEDNWKWHYLGVGHYLRRDYRTAIELFEKADEVSARHDRDLISCEADWIWTAAAHLGDMERARAAVAGITADTLVVPVIGDDEGYRDICLLLNGTMSPEQFLDTVGPDNEGGAVNGLYALAKYFHYVEGDDHQARAFLDRILADTAAKGWGLRLARMDAEDDWGRGSRTHPAPG
ncbi:tetratricopeptide repeat protein [Nakamurella leprariae]|uniref:Tetratricopeptide repeat protein n=1 Tax=Nakamurella leprariae TaxID=2803911 RepID=A0A938YEU6_9ACTN|nr:hypothetical protein [Nakamurella leprariae]MBM9468559.1 hypothetical protein [Nakamurella leprariae]